MGETVSFTAALRKGDQGDRLVLSDGKEVQLPASLPYDQGESLVIHIAPRDATDSQGQTLAKKILQEILDGS